MIGLICGTFYTVKRMIHIFREWMGIEVEKIERLNFREGEWPGSLIITKRDGIFKTSPIE
jgi:coenzyme F420-reducing hydrogenase beta subunit